MIKTTPRSLRPYQEARLTSARSEVGKGFTRVLIQLPTGTGKTRMISAAINNAISKTSSRSGKPQEVWFIVPRKELLWQTKDEFKQWSINNQIIAGGDTQRAGFQTYIWSRETLRRRITAGKIRRWPDIIMIDEAHLALDQQLFIFNYALEGTIFLGLTATPERLDGRGLNELWEVLIEGEQLQYFVENGYLKRPYVLSIPPADRIISSAPKGLIKFGPQGDLTQKTNKIIDELYESRKGSSKILFGNEIEHYYKHANGQQTLAFCRTLVEAEKVAENFRDAGVKAKRIDGKMSDKERKYIVESFKGRDTTLLTSVDLLTYGFDAPGASALLDMALTMSVAKHFQKLGRILRPSDIMIATIMDMVGNCDQRNHGHPLEPRTWNFTGAEKRKKPPDDAVCKIIAAKKCPVCWDIIVNGVCRTCGTPYEMNSKKPLKQVDGWLVEITGPTTLKDRPTENQRHFVDMINNNVDAFRNEWETYATINRQAVENLIEVSIELRWKNGVKQVYYKLVPETDMIINVSLIKVIADIKGYHHMWCRRFRQDLERRGLNKIA